MNSTQTVGIRVPVGHIIINSRWAGNSIISDLQGSIPVHFENTTSAIDFYPSCYTGVIFISEADMVEGTSYKRRVARLRKANKVRGIVMVEKTSTSAQYVHDVQKFCVSDLGLDVIPVANLTEAAGFLVQMVYVEGRVENNPFQKPVQVSAPDAGVLTALTSCPGVGETKALALLEKFPSLELLCKASQAELAAVTGRASAVKLYQFFHNVT